MTLPTSHMPAVSVAYFRYLYVKRPLIDRTVIYYIMFEINCKSYFEIQIMALTMLQYLTHVKQQQLYNENQLNEMIMQWCLSKPDNIEYYHGGEVGM